MEDIEMHDRYSKNLLLEITVSNALDTKGFVGG
jgi:hypothetical protein